MKKIEVNEYLKNASIWQITESLGADPKEIAGRLVRQAERAGYELDEASTAVYVANWIEWEDVQKKQKELADKIAGFKGKLTSPSEWDTLLQATVLSLYTLIPPRRNDYLDMYVVRTKKGAEDLPKDKNYLVLSGNTPQRFIFNKYKTAKKHGQQSRDIPEDLARILSTYLSHHPLNKKTSPEFKFLVLHDGSGMSAVNSITRVLNKAFGKKVGSSMLRHIYLSAKYDVDEMEEDAEAMAHTVEEQSLYLKKDGDLNGGDVNHIQ